MLKQSLSQKMLQKLSPQQIQLMKLLQVPTVMLEQRIKEELEANPALDEGTEQDELADIDKNNEADDNLQEADDIREDQYELDDYLNDYIEDDPASYKLRANNYSTEEEEKSIPIPVESSFHDYLEQQLGLQNLGDERLEAIADAEHRESLLSTRDHLIHHRSKAGDRTTAQIVAIGKSARQDHRIDALEVALTVPQGHRLPTGEFHRTGSIDIIK